LAAWKSKRKIMQRYDITADIYEERYAQEQKAKYKKALENINIENAYVLDVGCGSGLFFREAATQPGVVIGVDVSHKLLRKANQQAKALKNAFVVQADADHLPVRDKFFGAVFAFTVLQNVPKPERTLDELKRVVKSGGWVVVTGLKKAFPLEVFMDVLETSGLRLVSFVDEETINCYIAVLAA